jgi:predicted NAD/FAD-binding protein
MAAAHLLAKTNAVVLYEAEPRLGGHARTIIAGRRKDQPVDTGFIVFNHVNYPHLVRLFDALGVPTTKSSMSFGASIRGGRLEYGWPRSTRSSRSARTPLIPASCGCCPTSSISTATPRRWRPTPP